MARFSVLLTSINDVKRFVNAACAQPCDIDVIAGRYIIDAKSIMGIFSVDLSKPIAVEVHGTDADAETFRRAIVELLADKP